MSTFTLTVATRRHVATVSVDVDTNGHVDTNGSYTAYIPALIPPLVRNFSNYPLQNMNNYSVPFHARIQEFSPGGGGGGGSRSI